MEGSNHTSPNTNLLKEKLKRSNIQVLKFKLEIILLKGKNHNRIREQTANEFDLLLTEKLADFETDTNDILIDIIKTGGPIKLVIFSIFPIY